MIDEPRKVRRILHLKTRTTAADPSQLLSFVKASIPFYQALGGTRIRLLRNVDDPSHLVQEVEYETQESFEMNRHQVASDPTMRTFLQTWKSLLMGAVEIDVYEDVTDSTP